MNTDLASRQWLWFAVGSAFFAGLTAIFAKIGVRDLPSNVATFIRTSVILAFFAAVIAIRQEWQNPLSWPTRSLVFIVLSAFATALSWMCYFRALQLGPASLVATVDKLGLVVAILLAVAFLGERLSVMRWVGASLVTAGVVVLTLCP